MFKQLLIILIAFFSIQSALASQMSVELSQCLGLKSLSQQHEAWKSDFHRFKVDDSLSFNARFELSKASTKIILNRLQQVQEIASLEGENAEFIQDTSRFLMDLEAGFVSRTMAHSLMTLALPKFEIALDLAFEKAQQNNHSCVINSQQ